MNLELQVCSLELAKRLKELGVKQDSLFWYVKWIPPKGCTYYSNANEWKLSLYKGSTDDHESISAFTVAELGEMLSCTCISEKIYDSSEWIAKFNYYSIKKEFVESTEANARAKMLIWLIEEGHLKL